MHHSGTVTYDGSLPGIVIRDLTLDNPAVLAEASHWSTGQRAAAVEPTHLADVDLTAFVRQAMAVGVQAITAAGGAQDKLQLEQLMGDFTRQTAAATQEARDSTQQVVTLSAETMTRAATDLKTQLESAQKATAGQFRTDVRGAQESLRSEITRLLGGDDPELLTRLSPVLDTFGQKIAERSLEQTQALVDRAGRLFNADDPTSPMAKHTRKLEEQHRALTTGMAERDGALTERLTELENSIKVAFAGRQAALVAERASARKGTTYEDAVHAVMHTIATGLGDEYAETGAKPGRGSLSKKGDGVLSIAGSDCKLVLEMTDSVQKRAWSDYLALAETTRGAQASLGLVPSAESLGGEIMRCIGPRRLVMVFQPDSDDPALLRSVVQLLRLAAQVAGCRGDHEGLQTAEEKITEALAELETFFRLQKVAVEIRKKADTLVSETGALQEKLSRLLVAARTALTATADAASAA